VRVAVRGGAVVRAHELTGAHGESGGTFLRFGLHRGEEKKRMRERESSRRRGSHVGRRGPANVRLAKWRAGPEPGRPLHLLFLSIQSKGTD
jgi:hypothetical protein